MDDVFDRLSDEVEDRYAIERELGAGGMALVYLATDLKHHRQVAIKVLRPELSATLGTERFLREIEISAQLQHPHILPLHDSGEAGGLCYYVMPYVDGPSLRSRLSEESQLPFGETIQLVREIAGALDYANQMGIIHRDIKPENILLSQGHAIIADFGIARAVTAARGETLTVEGSSIGSPSYMSPEQVDGREIDARTDQYALACMAFEMLAGRQVFQGDTLASLFQQHLLAEPPPLSASRPDLPEAATVALNRALAKSPDDRFATAGEFAEALSGGVLAVGLRSLKAYKQRRALVAVLLTLAVIVVGVVIFPGESTPEFPRLAVLPFENHGAQSDEYVADGITESITTRLTAIGQLSVVSRQSAMQYKDSEKSAREIADELHVEYLLAGSVQRERPSDPSSKVRINPRLIHASEDVNLWGRNFDVDLTDLFQVYAEVGEEIAQQLDLTLLEPVRQAMAMRPTENQEAYDFYLRGTGYFARRVQQEEAYNAIQMFERATELDTTFAEAFAALSHALAWYAWDFDGGDELTRAEAAIDRALALAPDRSAVQLAAGFYSYYGALEYDEALQRFEAVRALEPNNADVINAVGLIHRRLGHWDQAVESFEEAAELSPQEYFVAFLAAQTHAAMRHFEQAERYYDRALSIAPAVADARIEKAWLYVHWDGATDRAWDLIRGASREIDPSRLAPIQMWLHVLDGDYEAAMALAAVVPTSEGSERAKWFVPYLAGQQDLVATFADSARVAYENALTTRPSEPQLHGYLGAAYAALDMTDDAVREGLESVALRPDAFTGPTVGWNLALIYVMLDQPQLALAQLETLASAPSRIDLPPLRLDPSWAPLHDNPRFQRLLPPEL
jgi:serine/threonine-protein kinase